MICGATVGLRAVEEHDLEQLLQWRNDPALRRHFREYRELNTTQQRTWFDAKVNADPCTRMFAIVALRSGRLLGAAGLCMIDWVNRSADFSIYLGADDLYIDTLFAPDAARVLMRYGFGDLGLHRLWAEIYDFDHRKAALFNTLGFRLEGRHLGTHWVDGAWCDSLFYGLLANEAAAVATMAAMAAMACVPSARDG